MSNRLPARRPPRHAPADTGDLAHKLGERVKELGCLYALTQIIERCSGDMDRLMREAVQILPGAWQYPQDARARIVLDGKQYASAGHRRGVARQSAPLTVNGTKAGLVEVCYLKRFPRAWEGPFLKEERHLIDAVAGHLSRAVERRRADERRQLAENRLTERLNELNCLYGVTRAIESCGGSVPRLMSEVVQLLPAAWQYPQAACARIVFDGQAFATADFVRTEHAQSAPIVVHGEPRGMVEVCYRSACPPADEGPFLKEERSLIDAVAGHLARAVELFSTADALRNTNARLLVEQRALQESNAALRTVLARIEEEKRSIGQAVAANVDRILMPIIDALEIELPAEQRGYTRLLRKNLEEITSPLVDRLSRVALMLTPAEVRVCNMIRMGLSSKEIAELRHVSRATVSRQRESIRRKLGLSGRRVNLATYLQTFGESLSRAEQRRML